MNMFSALQQVDEHVKRICNISKNSDDIDFQCLNIAKLYFDINEFVIAKSYIERYMKAKSNSESGLLLKAKIHEKLKEYKHALDCYENLYNVCNKKCYIASACQCLLSSDVDDHKAKMWIDILENEDSENELLIELKIRFLGTLNASSKELENLENKMKTDPTTQLQKQYLAILERVQVSDNVLTKCIELLNNYDCLDNLTIVKSCLKIFERAGVITTNSYNPIYCVLLIAMVKNQVKSSEYDCAQYLSKLYTILKDQDDDGVYIELKSQFLYHMISFAHGKVNKTMTTNVVSTLYYAYSCLRTKTKPPQVTVMSKNVQSWLIRQYKYRCSFINHMIVSNVANKSDATTSKCVALLSEIVWPSASEDYSHLTKMLGEKKKIDTSKMIELDIECQSDKKMNFSLIIWQLMGYLNINSANNKNEISFTPQAALFINSLLATHFPKLNFKTTHSRCPENICKIDLITFLIGAVLTYKKSTNAMVSLLPFPFEYMTANIRVIDTSEKWWNAACDFLLNNKRNTSIGAMRDFFKKGLEMVQVIDCKLPESLRLHLGMLLAQFANESKCNESENEVLLERSIALLYSVINESRSMSPSRIVPTNSFSSQTSLVIRQNNFKNSPFNKNQNIVIFDTEDIATDVLEKWRFEAYLSYIDWKLKRSNNDDDAYLYDLHDLIDTAETMDHNNPSLYLVKSRLYLAYAQRSINNNEAEKVYDFLAKASECVTRGQQYINTVNKIDRDELDSMLIEQLAAIDALRNSDSLLDFTCADESSNNTDMQFCGSKVIEMRQRPEPEGDRYIAHDDAALEIINEKFNQSMNVCLNKIEDTNHMSEKLTHDIELLTLQSQTHKQYYSDLVSKCETLNRALNKFVAIEDNCQQVTLDNKHLKQQVNSLRDSVFALENRNFNLELKFDQLQQSSLLQSHLTDFAHSISSKLRNTQSKVQGHLQQFDNLELSVANMCLNNWRPQQHYKQTMRHAKNESSKTECNIVDLAQLTRNKWQCPDCMVNNEDTVDRCLCCNAVNPNSSTTVKSKNVFTAKTENGFDLSRFSRNKWQCPTCLNQNEDSLSICPSCKTVKADSSSKVVFGSVSKETLPTGGFDLSRFTVNKWQCPSCLNHNEDSLSLCPSCKTVNPNCSNFEGKGEKSFGNSALKIVFGSNSNKQESVTEDKSRNFFNLLRDNQKTDTTPIVFGSSINKSIDLKSNFGKPCSNTKVEAPTSNTTIDNTLWRCECTTKNSTSTNTCIACGESRDDSDDDVIFVSEPYVTEEQKMRARALLLPDHFFYFENLPDKDNGSSTSDNEEKVTGGISMPDRVAVTDAVEEADGDNDEDYDPQYQPIVSLPVVSVTTGEEGWTAIYQHRCKLFRFVNNGWAERGLGEMKIVTRENETGKLSARLLMRRQVVHRVCCSHAVMKNCPSFFPLKDNMACWMANDFSDGTAVPTKEKFAILFKTEEELAEFKAKIAELQATMEEIAVSDD